MSAQPTMIIFGNTSSYLRRHSSVASRDNIVATKVISPYRALSLYLSLFSKTEPFQYLHVLEMSRDCFFSYLQRGKKHNIDLIKLSRYIHSPTGIYQSTTRNHQIDLKTPPNPKNSPARPSQRKLQFDSRATWRTGDSTATSNKTQKTSHKNEQNRTGNAFPNTLNHIATS